MPACENLKNEVLTYFETHFGVAAKALAGLIFQEKDQEIWATSALPCEGISSRRPSGMRILRRTPSGLKPTSTFLQLLGERITAARVEIQEINTLRRLLFGTSDPGLQFGRLCRSIVSRGCAGLRVSKDQQVARFDPNGKAQRAPRCPPFRIELGDARRLLWSHAKAEL